MTHDYQRGVIQRVILERQRQDKKWGANSQMPDSDWHLILSEEVGEVAQAILNGTRLEMEDLTKIEDEVVQVAAVAVAWLEDLELFKAQLEAWEAEQTCS